MVLVSSSRELRKISRNQSSHSQLLEENLQVTDEQGSYSYFAYGLGIQSEIPIPEFFSTDSTPDVTIEVDRQHKPHYFVPQEVLDQPLGLKLDRKEAVFYLQETGVFLISNGNKITVIPTSETSEELIRYALVGTVMAILLYQRGLLVLHGSAVNIDGEAMVFLGNSGEGKSSMAAAFHSKGYGIITDDVAPVNLSQNPVTINPGFPQMKLSSEVASTLDYDFDSLKLLHPKLEKRGYVLTENFSALPLPLRKIYVLASGNEVSIKPLKPGEAVMELIRHSRPTTLLHAGDKAHFTMCVSLAKQYNIFRLQRPRNLALLPKLVELIKNQI